MPSLSKRSPSLHSALTPDASLVEEDPILHEMVANGKHPYLQNGHGGDRGLEEYPPSSSSMAMADQSSVHLPLLERDDYQTSSPRGRRTPSMNGTFSRSRVRLHPLTLLPAVLLGFLFGNAHIFGGSSAVPSLKSAWSSSSSSHSDKELPFTPIYNSSAIGANYTLHQNGHLYLHPSSLDPASVSSPFTSDDRDHLNARHGVRHPIEDLIANATRDWESKLSRQSQTLRQAIEEYRRRYNRRPPKGFDRWFKFAKENNVQLIDEFDTIHRDLEPFWALPPKEIRRRAEELQREEFTFTFVFKDQKIDIIGAHKKDGRANAQLGLMKRWVQWAPDVNISMSAHDGPSILMDTNAEQLHRKAAQENKLLTKKQWELVDDDAGLWGFPLACHNESRIRRYINGLEASTLPSGASYIYNHVATMDMCENPEWQYLHGFTAWPGPRPDILKPLFSMSKTTMHNDILLTPLEQWDNVEPWDPVWEKKLYNKAVWRGSTTGVWFDRLTWWRSSQRMRLHWISTDKEGTRLVRFNGKSGETGHVESIVERNVSTAEVSAKYLDFAFTGKAEQCTEDDGSCDALKKVINFQPGFGWNQANEYKYQIDIDGNGWSGRFHRLLSSNSAIVKSSIFPEWYQDWIQPWVHYIPVKIDYTDLFDIMAFFAGDLDGNNGHDDLARQIGQNGKEYAAKFWRFEDMEAYNFRLALEWARCTADNRHSMDYTG